MNATICEDRVKRQCQAHSNLSDSCRQSLSVDPRYIPVLNVLLLTFVYIIVCVRSTHTFYTNVVEGTVGRRGFLMSNNTK